MVVRLCLFISIILFESCERKVFDLRMTKREYMENGLRIDGYYYSSPTSHGTTGVAVFYRDGVCLHTFTRLKGKDTLGFIEKSILLNENLMSDFWNTPNKIGVFQVKNETIEFETWDATRDITTFSHLGEILNDTTFSLKRRVNNDIGKVFPLNLTYRFQQFSPKPDSTNTFIK